ncbi:tetraspanin-9 isoform X2 [Betta splendens]|uniref:Tetraspanin n=1 Tax=Betta splendens TaxID=158456 RepID=A0A6P7NLG0_BETSP|nr:tetraspanin-9 isoform X2 [Betta splendens]
MKLSGCLILAVGIYLKVTNNANQITSGYLPGADLMIAIGVIIMVLGFLGCCGAIRENRCLLLLFFISLLIIFILLLAAGILGAIGQKQVENWVKEQMDNLNPLSGQPAEVVSDLEKIQIQLHCCGLLNGPSDWGSSIPSSCNCNSTVANCGNNVYYTTPCATKVITLMKNSMVIVLGIAFAIAVLLIFGMAFSMVLYCQIGRKEGATRPANA